MKPRIALVFVVVIGWFLTIGDLSQAQAPIPRQNTPAVDLNALTHQMADRVRHLGEDIASDLGRTPQGRHLLQDLQELAQTTDEFHDALHDTTDPYQRREAYIGIHQTWTHLKSQLAQPGISTSAVDRAARRVDELDSRIQQALGLRPEPRPIVVPGPPGGNAPPQPTAQCARMQQLSYGLVHRAEHLAATVRAESPGWQNSARYQRQADRLAQACGSYYDTLRASTNPNFDIEANRRSFQAVVVIADQLENDLKAIQRPQKVDECLQAFATTEYQIRQELKIPDSPFAAQIVVRPSISNGAAPLIPMADQILKNVDTFLTNFTQASRNVPESPFIIADAERLKVDAIRFRRSLQRGGGNVDYNRLTQDFTAMDLSWQRLARRVQRVAKGRTGPNIQLVDKMGDRCEQIRAYLGAPG